MSGWREQAKQLSGERRKQVAAWKDGIERDRQWVRDNVDRVLEILYSDDGKAEALAAARATGSANAAADRHAKTDVKVLQKIVDMNVLPEPRNLVGVLVAGGSGDKDAIRASLRRLATQGVLPEEYRQHFG